MSFEIEGTEVGSEVNEGSAAVPGAADGGDAQGEGAAPPAAKDATEGAPAPGDEIGDEPPAYKAPDKFKVMIHGSDSQQEHEVPAWIKPMMKDEASAKEAITLLEKAYGLEPVKASRQQIREERDTVKGELGEIQRTITDVRAAYQRGDIDGFLSKLAIPPERMLKWALDKVNYSQLPPEQQAALDASQEAQRKAYQAEQQVLTYQEQLVEQVRNTKRIGLDSGLARPEVMSFAEAYDARVGKPGAFRAEVISGADLAYTQSNGKVDLSPEQAIEQALTKWRPFLQTPGAVTPGTPPAASAGSGTGSQAPSALKAAVIPNVQGRSQSPMRPAINSLEDLKKLRAQGER